MGIDLDIWILFPTFQVCPVDEATMEDAIPLPRTALGVMHRGGASSTSALDGLNTVLPEAKEAMVRSGSLPSGGPRPINLLSIPITLYSPLYAVRGAEFVCTSKISYDLKSPLQ